MEIRRRRTSWRNPETLARFLPLPLFLLGLLSVAYLVSLSENSSNNRASSGLSHSRNVLSKHSASFTLPARVKGLIEKGEVIGDRLKTLEKETSSVEEILSGVDTNDSNQSPMTLQEITEYLLDFLHKLHAACAANKKATFQEIWKIYHDLTLKTLYPWDKEYLRRMPQRRNDGTMFVSLASYRDENCLSTLKQAFANAKNPEKLYIGLVQQNCESDCRTGVLTNLKMEPTEPDQDCHRVYCASEEGKQHCDAGRVRALHVNETESLGPYAARYFASKLWYGEEWFMQIDSHMTFAKDWDARSIEMLEKAPSKKPVLSHYPPSETTNLNSLRVAAPRLCGGIIAETDLEVQIVRLQITVNDQKVHPVPRFAPVVAAGYFVATSEFLRDVPFDPFLPYIFMGEEIIMSSRLWTSGYDIFSPTQSVVGHIYYRRHKPKFWENVHRVFRPGVHNPLQMMILHRVKYQLGYPESQRDVIMPKTILTAVEEYTMGKERTLEDYLEMAGYDFNEKVAITPEWCGAGIPPPNVPEYQQYKSLYS